jgi:iron complex outermembrane receptor protein
MLMLFGFNQIVAQTTVTGTVTSDDGPLIGATVLEQGTSNGTVTDLDGNFSLSVGANAVLEVSYTGYAPQEITVGSQTNFSITLAEGAIALDNVVVTALGIKKEEKALGYAVQSLGGDEIATSSEANVLSSLQGKIAGVQIGDGNGVSGGTTRITIRGNNSLVNGKNQPLIIVDGVAIENSITGAGSGTLTGNESGQDWGSGINNINSWDIEDMTVLKGPNAAALYGARGANGVILITTKKGRQRKGIGIDVTTSLITEEAFLFRDVQNVFGAGSGRPSSQEFEQNDQGQNLLPRVGFWGSGVSWGPEMKGQPVLWWNGETLPFDAQPNNIENFFRNGSNNSVNLAFSGASDIGSFRASLTRNETTPITPNSDRTQNTINLNTSINVTEKLTANASVSFMDISTKNAPVLGNSERSIGKNLLYNWGRSYRPDLEEANYLAPDGSRQVRGIGYPGNDALGRGRGRAGSFFWNIYENNQWRNRDRLLGSLSLNYEIAPWLSIEGRLGIDNYNDDNISKNTPTDPEGLRDGRYSRTLGKNRIQNHLVMARINKDLTEDLNLGVNLGAEHWSRSYYHIQGDNGGLHFADPNLYTFRNADLGNRGGSDIFNRFRPQESFFDKEINSTFASVDLAYKSMLYLTLTGRNDWSSTLPLDNNSYFYPSVSLGYVFTESLNIAPGILSFGKLRLAWAQTANDTDPYQLIPTFQKGNFANQPTASVRSTIPPVTLEPEQSNSYDIGLDLRFLNGKVNLDMTYYYISSINQILDSPLPISSGFNKLRFNTGEVENKGFELILSATPYQARDFEWEIGFNFSTNRNKVIALSEGAEKLNIGGIFGGNGPSVEARPGEDYGTIMGWDYTYFDENGNGTTDDSEIRPDNRLLDDNGEWYELTSERVPVGNVVPDWLGGISNTVRWKDFSFSALIDIRKGGDVFFGSHAIGMAYGQSPATLEGRTAEYGGLPYTDGEEVTRNIGVIKEGKHADGTTNSTVVPHYRKYQDHFTWGAGAGPVSASVFDGSFIRLREMSLTYTMPKSLVDKAGFINNLSLTLLGRNLWFLKNNAPDNLNPAAVNGAGISQGMEWGSLPGTRSYGAVLRVGF